MFFFKPGILKNPRQTFVCLLLLLVSLLVFGQVGRHEFIDFDDDIYVTENKWVKGGLTLEGVIWSLTTRHGANWHPVTWLSHMTDVELFGMEPGGHHLVSLGIHLMSSVFLFAVFIRMTGALWRSAVVAGLFALHPLHVESVAWVAERKDLLCAFFWILVLWSYIRYAEALRPALLSRVYLFFILGFMAKPMIVTLPFVLLLMDYWPLGRIGFSSKSRVPGVSLRSAIREKIPLFLLSVVMSSITFTIQKSGGAVASLSGYSLYERAVNLPISYMRYILKTLWPVDLSVYYPLRTSPPTGEVAGALAVLSFLCALAVYWRKSRPWFTAGWLWFLGTLLPVIGIVQVGSQAIADRYTYMPLIGLFIIAAWGVPELTGGRRWEKMILSGGAVVLFACLAALSWRQVGYWKNSIRLFEHAIAVTENNFAPHNNLGLSLEREGRLTEAIDHYTEAVRIFPDYKQAHNNLANALARQGDLDAAIRHYTEALRIDPDFSEAHNNLANVLSKQGRMKSAMVHYRRALESDPGNAEAHYNLGIALFTLGKIEGAVDQYLEAIRIEPKNADYHNNLAAAFAALGKTAEAISHLREALRLSPQDGNATENLKKLTGEQ